MATLALASLTKGEFVGRALCMFRNGREGDEEEREEDKDLFFSFLKSNLNNISNAASKGSRKFKTRPGYKNRFSPISYSFASFFTFASLLLFPTTLASHYNHDERRTTTNKR
jgi:hypothetical protein